MTVNLVVFVLFTNTFINTQNKLLKLYTEDVHFNTDTNI